MREEGGECGNYGAATVPASAKRDGTDCRPAAPLYFESQPDGEHGLWRLSQSASRHKTRAATSMAAGPSISRLRRILRIACAWIGLSETLGFRAPPAIRALETQGATQQAIWRSTETKVRSPEELLSAAPPPEPSFRFPAAQERRYGALPNSQRRDQTQTAPGDSPSDSPLPPVFPILPLQQAPESLNPEAPGQALQLEVKPTVHASELPPVQEGSLFREATIRPAPSAAIANPALTEITRYSDARRSGPLTYILRLTQSAILDSNVNASELNRRRDLQVSVGPAILTQLGNEETKWRVGGVYIGAFNDFVNRSAAQTFDQIGSLSINSNTNRIRFSLQTSAQKLTSSFPDLGERVTRTTLYGAGTMVCKWSEKLSSEMNADFTDSSFDRFLSSKEYRVQSLHLYDFSAKTRIGLGTAIGVLRPNAGFEQRYTQGLTRIEYQPTEKLRFNALGGMERREFQETNTHSLNPVWLASASWTITQKTALALNVGRRAFASASLAFQNYAVTSISLSLSHQFTQSLSTSITGQYETSKYTSASSGVRTGRVDHYLLGRLELAWAIKRWISASSFLELSENNSEGEGAQPFSRTRAGLSLNLSF